MFIFVVGIPRSGSTLLSNYFNTDKDVISLNDFYFIQFILSNYDLYLQDAHKFKIEIAKYLLSFLHERVHINNKFEGQIKLKESEITEIISKFESLKLETELLVEQLIAEYYQLLKSGFNCKVLVDKTPQNFFNYELLKRALPKSKFLFLFRSPYETTCSFKFADFKGHDKRRYHPLIYAKYWNKPFDLYKQICKNEDITSFTYNELKEPNIENLRTKFLSLNVNVNVNDVDLNSNNSSKKSSKKMDLNGLEKLFITRINKIGLNYFNEPLQHEKVKLIDFLDLIKKTFIFTKFNIARAIKSKDARIRILKFISFK